MYALIEPYVFVAVLGIPKAPLAVFGLQALIVFGYLIPSITRGGWDQWLLLAVASAMLAIGLLTVASWLMATVMNRIPWRRKPGADPKN